MNIIGGACAVGLGVAFLVSCGARSGLGLFDDGRADAGDGAKGGVVLAPGDAHNGRAAGTGGRATGAGGVAGAGISATGGAAPASAGTAGVSGSLPSGPTAAWEVVMHTPSPGGFQGPSGFYESVWSDSATRAWITSETDLAAGSLLRWENGAVSVERDGCRSRVFTVRGRAASDLWSAGCDTALLHRSGPSWSTVSAPRSTWVWENSPNDLWVCCDTASSDAGAVPVASNWDGSAWRGVSLPSMGYQGGNLWSGAAHDLWIATADILHWDGAVWTTFNDPSRRNWRSVWGVGTTVWAAGTGGRVARIRDGSFESFATEALLPEGMELEGVWGRSVDDVWFVGLHGAILHWNGTTLVRDSAGIETNFTDVWGADNTLWIVGHEETLVRRRLN